MKPPRLRVIAGPNGSGKSTLLQTLIKREIPLGVTINADEIENLLRQHFFVTTEQLNLPFPREIAAKWSLFWQAHGLREKLNRYLTFELFRENVIQTGLFSYLSAALGEFLRQEYLLQKCDFTFETVFSDTSKVDFLKQAKGAGYKIYLYYVCLESAELNVQRVKDRMDMGGHFVPDEKIRSRYQSALNNLVPAFDLADNAYLFDNSIESRQFLQKVNGEVSAPLSDVPGWAKPLCQHLNIH
ncbi:MAG: zeta toxin family protein [Bacteroidetes bacterium]|nr:zeta toxin family protein [Bacteroidota bacterium]